MLSGGVNMKKLLVLIVVTLLLSGCAAKKVLMKKCEAAAQNASGEYVYVCEAL
jgi:uncharacterized protein YceK